MSKNRYINTHFWDDPYIESLEPQDKLLFLYLLTNPLTSICGVYEISIKRICSDTGFTKERVLKALKGFEGFGKIYYSYNFIIIVNFVKHQSINNNIKKGIESKLQLLPDIIKASKGFERLLKALNYLNLNLNININLNSNLTETKNNISKDFETPDIEKENKPLKKTFLKFVKLSEDEYNNLIVKFGEKRVKEMIENLNNYIGSKGKKYKSHYHTLLVWHKDEVKNVTTNENARDLQPNIDREFERIANGDV